MSDAHDRNTERLRRIHVVTEKAEAAASASEPTADVITQKIVQELTALRRQNDALATQIKEIRQEQQAQSVELDALRSKQHSMGELLKAQQEKITQKLNQPVVSPAAIKNYVNKRLFAFKMKFVGWAVLIGIVVALFLFWPERGKSEPQQSSATNSSVSETGRAQ